MTSPLRRKRPTTAPAPSTPTRTLASLLGLVLAGSLAAQEPRPLPPAPWQVPVPELGQPRRTAPPAAAPASPIRTLSFSRPALDQPPPDVLPVQFQGPGPSAAEEYEIRLEPPSLDRLIKLESEESLRQRLRQEARNRTPPERVIFPEEKPVIEERFRPRSWPLTAFAAEPNYVAYRPLLFEERNAERHGWDLGIIQPLVSTGHFFADVVALPYNIAKRPCWCLETGAGECLPGDPVPYLLYPPGVTWTGAVTEAGAVLGLIAIFP